MWWQSKRWLPLLVALVAGTSCGFGGSSEDATSTTAAASTSSSAATTAATTTSTVAPTTTTTIPATTTTTLPPLPPLPEALAAQVDELIAVTEAIRGLAFLRPPRIEVLTPDEVTERRREGLEEDLIPEELEPEAAFYALFGILEPEDDLYSFYTDFYSAGTLAYYDLETQHLVVPLAGETLNEYEKWILVHELTHALTDQHHPEIGDRYETADEDGDFDEIGALLGLLEGEAVLVQSIYFDSLPSDLRNEVVTIGRSRSNEAFQSAPAFFRDLLRFPYTNGSLLTADLHRRGGMEALNQAFDRPPESTEQVMHPDRYVAQESPTEVAVSDIELEGYEVFEEGTWGERGWRILLDHYLGASAAAQAADGWGGDHYRIYWNAATGEVIFVVEYTADSFGDASEIAGAIGRLVEIGMEVDESTLVDTTIEWFGESYAYLERDGISLTLVAAADPDDGARVAALLRADSDGS